MTTGPVQDKLYLTFNGDTDVGQSRQDKPNQDSFDTYEHYCDDPARLAAKGKLFVVADGMGGAAGGKEASSMAVDVVFRTYYDDPDPEIVPSLERAIQAANTHIQQYGRANPELRGLGTTIVVAVIRDRMLVVGNVGDSRAYLLRDGELSQVSLDHTMVQEQVRDGLLTPEEALTHPRRHVLSRNLGYRPKAGPDFDTWTLAPGDTILLCSDGLWGPVEDAQLAAVLRQHSGDAAVQMLIDLANRRCGPDNISAIVIHVHSVAPVGASGKAKWLEPVTEEVEPKQQTAPETPTPTASAPANAQTVEHLSPANSHSASPPASTAPSTGRAAHPPGQQPGWSAAVIGAVMLLLLGVGVYLAFSMFWAQPAAGSSPLLDGRPAGQLPPKLEEVDQAGAGETTSDRAAATPARPLSKDYYKSNSISTIAFTPSDRLLVVAQADRTVEWWDMRQAVLNPSAANETGENIPAICTEHMKNEGRCS